ncbi:MAG: hypothetical protein A2751_02280 [Candidatus Doudnabacteria bacterium RIFCSPHIGHO2_01_FULL_46_14]|uniref:Uncharacterized protein n=1 Tax=Candidatus Doudnabacteria bacterium RIFCSPHIGHO2_01_FULL_46_14 TaxID=1817824 RepID=A0A1F5NJK8_9BACT|nr:MAG: hypothetical protein A2751_02280 [Candidatus Doudnabacteria bacterium RIFCSPHIGHO2_01_FULL_46_14]
MDKLFAFYIVLLTVNLLVAVMFTQSVNTYELRLLMTGMMSVVMLLLGRRILHLDLNSDPHRVFIVVASVASVGFPILLSYKISAKKGK